MAIKIKELREKYPQYNDMDDKQFADAFYKKYYSDMPIEQYYEKVGFSPQKEKGWGSVFSDALKSIKEAPSEIAEGFKEFLPQTAEASTQLLNPQRLATNLAIGLNKGGRGALNTIPEIGEYLQSKGIGGDLTKWLASKKMPTGLTDWEQQALNAAPETYGFGKRGDEAIQGGASFLPYMATPGGLPAKALMGALWGVGQEQNPFTTAGMGVLPETVPKSLKTIGAGASRAKEFGSKFLGELGKEDIEGVAQNIAEKPSKLGRILPTSELSAEELMQNLEAARGTKTALGNVLENPKLQKRYENVLGNMESTGAIETMDKTARQIRDRGNKFLEHLEAESTPEQRAHVGETLKNALLRESKEAEKIKNQKYAEVSKLASEKNVEAKRSDLRKYARNKLEEVESDKDLAAQTDPKIKKVLEDAATESGDEVFSLKKTNILRGKFGDLAREANRKGESHLAGIYAGMRDALTTDIESAIDKSKNPDLKKAYDEAQRYYREEWQQFDDDAITKFTKEGGDPDLLMQAFVKNSKISDRGNLLKKLTSKLKEGERDLLAHSYFSNAIDEGRLNPLKFRTLYKQLGDVSKDALVGKYKPVLDQYTRLIKQNTEPLTLMANPKTGARGQEQLVSLSGGALGALTGHDPGSAVLGAIILPQLKKQGLKIEAKAHTNERIREKIVKKLIEDKMRKSQQVPKDLQIFQKKLEGIRSEK